MSEQKYKNIMNDNNNEKLIGVDLLQSQGIEIHPHWDDEKPSIVIRKGDVEERIACIHCVLYRGNVENIPETISAEVVGNLIPLPDLETRKFALKSFVESVIENYPESLSREMVGINLSSRIRKALKKLGALSSTNSDLDDLLSQTEDSWAEFAHAYFWSPPGNAGGRRSYEQRHSWDAALTIRHTNKRGTIREFTVNVDFNVSCSCHNIYVNKSIMINGQKVNITKFRTFCNKVKDGASISESYIKSK